MEKSVTNFGTLIAEDFFSRAPKYRTKAMLVSIANEILEMQKTLAFNTGMREGNCGECHD